MEEMTNDDRIHVVPINDLRPHIASPNCWCKPTEDDEYPDVWVHNSMDEREQYEQGRNKS
jgi:hypothetical protein